MRYMSVFGIGFVFQCFFSSRLQWAKSKRIKCNDVLRFGFCSLHFLPHAIASVHLASDWSLVSECRLWRICAWKVLSQNAGECLKRKLAGL